MAAGNGFGFEAGNNGDALTSANSGSDFISTTGGTAVISTAQAMHGTRSALFTGTSTSGACYMQETFTATSSIAWRFYIRLVALPSADVGIFGLYNGSSRMSNLELTTTGALRLRDGASAAKWAGAATVSPGTMALNTWYRVEVSAAQSSTTGAFRVVVYPGDSTAPVSGLDSGVVTGINTGASQYNTARLGVKGSTSSLTIQAYLDTWDYDPTTTTLLGPYTEVLPSPTLTIISSAGPTSVGGSDGHVEIGYGTVAGASGYQVSIVDGFVSTGFDATAVSDPTSPHDFTALAAGDYTVAVRAKA